MATQGLGNYWATRLLNQLMGDQTITPPGTWYAALLTTLPSDNDGTGLVEVTGGSYARTAVTNNTTNFPSSTVVSHIATIILGTTINWGPASASWGTIVGIAFYDASSSGNLGPWGQLSSSKTIGSGDTMTIASGNGTFTAQ